jgi:hypothetical protein
MAEPRKPQTETLVRIADEFLALKLSEADRKAVTETVGSLSLEMHRMRVMPVGEAEPATIYQAAGHAAEGK